MAKKKTPTRADEILQIAVELGVEDNYFFTTTFERYEVQLRLLKSLEEAINSDGALVTKEYVKGRENVYTHPAVTEYNRTSTAANQTVSTLMKIISTLGEKTDDSSSALNYIKRGGTGG